MTVGLPGSGIGGIFYLLSALWMPCVGAQRAVRREAPRLGLVMKQTTLALGMIAALFATGWMIERLVMFSAWVSSGSTTTLHGHAVPHVLREATFALSFGTLGGVLLSVQVLRLFVGRTVEPAAAVAPRPRPAVKRKVA